MLDRLNAIKFVMLVSFMVVLPLVFNAARIIPDLT